MPVLMFEDEEGNFLPLLGAEKGDPGPQGPPGKDGAPGGFGPLDDLQDVTAPASTPVGKLLGTTAEGSWGPVDPPITGITQEQADARYVNASGDSMTGPLVLPGNAASNLQAVPKQQLDAAVTTINAALSRLDGRGQVYHGQRGASDQFVGWAGVLRFGSGAEVQPAGSQWLLYLRMVMDPIAGNIHIWALPSGLANCTVLHTDKDAAKLFISGSAADSWSPLPWVVTVIDDGPFSGDVTVTDGGGNASWWINKESSWLLARIK